MTFSRRVSLQWLPEPASEPTSTYVLCSPGSHFVDVRINDSFYPFIQNSKSDKPNSQQVFDWVSSGNESPVEGTPEIKFVLEIDSLEIWKAQSTGKPLSECRRAVDSGFFYGIEGSQDRKEVGNMLHPTQGVNRDYIEIWRSLDPNMHSPNKEVREAPTGQSSSYVVKVLITDGPDYEGKYVRLGNWSQGVIHNKKNHELQVIRAWFDGQKWVSQIQYGSNDFPLDFEGSKDDKELVNGIEWICVES